MTDLPCVLVTGASTGIGRATARHLADHGFHVFAGVRKQVDADNVLEEDKSIRPMILDITDANAIQHTVTEISRIVGTNGLYGLVNNAAVNLSAPLEYTTIEELRTVFETNVFGTLMLTRDCIPLLRQGKGRIVNISSGSGRVATPLMGVYSASKFALEALSDVLRVELRRSDIKVSVIEPGFTRTAIHGKVDQSIDELMKRLPIEGKAAYGEAIRRYGDSAERMLKSAPEATLVAAVVHRALTAKRPRPRYPAGREAAFMHYVGAFLGDGLRDRIWRQLLGL